MDTSLAPFTPLADRIWTARAEPDSVTIGLVAGDDGALVVDTGSTPQQGAAIREAAERTAGVPVVAVAVTHWHRDHLFGLAGFAGVPSYAHESVAAWIARPQCAHEAAALNLDTTELARPTDTLCLAKAIDLGGRRAEFVHFGPGHTDGDIVVLVPDADVIFTGDLLEHPGPPCFEPESSLDDWPKALDGILGATTDRTLLVPGHGDPVDRLFAFDQRARIAALPAQAAYLARQGVGPDEALSAGDWPFPDDVVAPLLSRLFAGLEISRPSQSR